MKNLDKVIREQVGLARFFKMVGSRLLSWFFVAMSLKLSILPDIELIALFMILIGKNTNIVVLCKLLLIGGWVVSTAGRC